MNINEFWRFAPLEDIEEFNFNGALERFYKQGISGLVRENIQNSLDGKLQELDKPVIVDIQTGIINKKDIPGFGEIKTRVNSLEGHNQYTKETIEHMKKSVEKEEVHYISFEDSNTKGLTGAKNGQSDSKNDTWGIYAYKKGVHSTESNSDIEEARGGSHGIGKIASNAASDLFLMYFANCDSEKEEHLGGTIQLIEHKYRENCYRSTGYFTNTDNSGKYIPFVNRFSKEFIKDTRGLKIIIPFLREEFNDEKKIIKSICDSFFVAILEKKLEVKVNDKTLDDKNIKSYIEDQDYYVQEASEIKDEFTPLYLDTYLNTEFSELEVRSKKDVYKFKLYFQINSDIKRGRLGIVRTVGMKIEDMKVNNNATKPFNAVLIPYSIKEDGFLKMLENESHTEISSDHIKDKETKSDAQRFVNNISRRLAEVIVKEIEKITPTDGIINTEDILYTVESKFKKDLEKSMEPVKILNPNGEGKQIIKDTGGRGKRDLGKKNTPPTKKVRRKKRVDKGSGEIRKDIRYNVNPDTVERLVIKDKEYIKINLVNSEIEKKKVCDLSFVVVDGMGKEYPKEFNISESYKSIVDRSTGEECSIEDNLIKDVKINKGMVDIEICLNEKTNKSLKFVYYLEV